MKTGNAISSSMPTPLERKGDSAKLVSLLALASGAVAMPQTSHADIIFTDLSSHPVTVGFLSGATNSFTVSLPGTDHFGFKATTRLYGYYHSMFAGKISGPTSSASVQASGSLRGHGLAVHLQKNAGWNNQYQLWTKVLVGWASSTGSSPNSYDHEYLSLRFKDSGATLYGWVEISLKNGELGYPAQATNGPDVTIYGYAYDNQGNKITMGTVPEPAPAAILAFGALTLGAKGLRSWRRNRVAPCMS